MCSKPHLVYLYILSPTGPPSLNMLTDFVMVIPCAPRIHTRTVHALRSSAKCKQAQAPTVSSLGKRRTGGALISPRRVTANIKIRKVQVKHQIAATNQCNGLKLRGNVCKVYLKPSRGSAQWQSTWRRSTMSHVRGNSNQ